MRVAGIANCWEWGAVGAVLVRRAPREQELGRVGQKKALGLHSSVEGGLGSQRARQPHFPPLLACFSLVLLSLLLNFARTQTEQCAVPKPLGARPRDLNPVCSEETPDQAVCYLQDCYVDRTGLVKL